MKPDQIDDLRSILRGAESLANAIDGLDDVLDDAAKNPSKPIEDILRPLTGCIKNKLRAGFLDAIKTYRNTLAAELQSLHYSTK
jgi:hypothetical protein